ncbi:hypothetical protein VIGAN_06026800 [Vigna angularis var. angularis]|uniref:NB-ARC domain-containing protein n=1 Tax=Vigna angularis var. angularis TaxID=157739 RepID=A0A0S3S900_PHAAN|nr:hypothetical protein VIGAN_06026800 [Vigna angularis var. angularis]
MAAELVGGALLSAFLQVAFDRLASPQVLHFFRGRKLDQKLLKRLKRKLRSIDALADDADIQQFINKRVKAWLADVIDALFEAEDLLDEIYEFSLREVEDEYQRTSNKVWNLNLSLSSVSFFIDENEIETRMEQVLDDLDELVNEGSRIGLKEASGVGVDSGSNSKVSQKSSSTSLLSERDDIYGRDDDKDIIFNWLAPDSDDGDKLLILSIMGMGGLGKTTLAQHVYHDQRIEGKFDIKAWVCVSDDFDVFKVTRTILEAITRSTDDSRNLEMVQGRLKEILSGNRFLLVLDDVWNESWSKWEQVQKALDSGAHGSRILVTTRSKKVALSMRSKEHHLKELQEDYCWQLFANHAFQNDTQANTAFKEIGKQIVEKCRGLPLALKTMGSLLHNKSSISEWENVLKSEIWELEDSDVIPALALSYNHLPSHLKRCYAYCALFPKDYEFDKNCLIQLWIAENFVQFHHHKSPEDIGEQYFDDLLSRSFFQQSNRYKTCFVMHDLLNDLAKYVCEDICFRLGVDKTKGIPKTTRHFTFATNHVEYFDGFGSIHDVERLHTFMPTDWSWHCKMSIDDLFSKFKFLRVLSVSNCSNLTKVPDSVGDLKHLRSLDLSNTHIERLPESTCSLYNLQILKLNNCPLLKELPSNLHKLTNLRRLEFMDTELLKVPEHLEKLKNLQVFMSSFDVGSKEFSIQQLGQLDHHGRLSIGELQNIENPSDAKAADLKNKTHLRELKLKWNRDQVPVDALKERDVNVMENLQPSKYLEKLSISHYDGTKFPTWFGDYSLLNVVSLSLFQCKQCKCLPSLGHLPFLKDLTISGLDGVVCIDADFYGSSSCSFPSLETLKFSHMKGWEKWDCEAMRGAFPRLHHLAIDYCPKLKERLPVQILHFETVYIRHCKQLLGYDGMVKMNGKEVTIFRVHHNMEVWFVEWIGKMISHDSVEDLKVYSCPNMSILMNQQYNFLVHAHNHLQDLAIIDCPQFESFPERVHILLPCLEFLSIRDCPRFESFSDGCLPSNIKRMYLTNSSKLVASLKGSFGDNPSLETLFIIGKLEAESFPDEGFLPLSLTSLGIYDCQHLKKLDYKGLCHVPSLKELLLVNCPSLQCLPDEGLPKSISYLTISGNCPLLKQRCKYPGGQDWGKIAHVQNLSIL